MPSDHVDPPVRDDIFARDDASLASALSDVSDADIAAELVSIHDGLSLGDAIQKVETDPEATRADVMRVRLTEQ